MSFICNICKKRCTKEIELQSHMNWHATYSGEFSIKCEFCDRLFDHVQHMENHRFFVHIRQKPTVKCQLCNKVFAHKRSFLRHNKSFHLNSKEFVCVICNKGFARKEYLNKHYLMHEKECEKSFVGSINEGSNMVTKVEADSEYEDNEEIKMEQNPSETFQSLTVPRAMTETAFRRKGICLKVTSGRRQIAQEFDVDQNGKPDVVVENLEIEEHDGEDVKTDFHIDRTKSENTADVSSSKKRQSRSESCERIGQCLTEIKSKDSAKGKGCRSSSNVKNECLKKLTKKFGSVTYIDEFVHDPNFESGTTECKDEGLKNSSGISTGVEISQKEHEHHKVDQSAMESPTNEECQLLKTKKPYSYVEGLNRIVANHMKIPLYVDLDMNNATTSAANRSESEVCKGKGSKQKGSCGNVERKVRTEIEEFTNERRTSNMADQSKSQGKLNIKLASWPEPNPKEVRDPKKHICTDKTCVERCRRNRKSNLDCWKRATGTNNIKVSSYSNASVDVVEYASSDILVVECFRDVGSDVSKDKTQAGKEDNEELCTDPCDDVRVMNVKHNNANRDINIVKKQNVNDKRNSLSLNAGTGKNVKESETEVINLIEDEDVKDTLSGEKLHADNQLHGRKAENVEPLKQNEAYVTKQIVNFDETRKNCQSVKHDVQENKPMYRNHVVGDLIGPYTITDTDANCKGLDLSIKGKTKMNTSKSSEITSHGNMANSTIREENQNSKCNVEKQMLFNGFIDKTNQRRNNGPRSAECDKNKTSVILPVFMKGIAADRKFNADKDCIIIEDAGVNEACLDKLLTENSSKGMTDNLKDLDKFLNWSVELNDSNDKSQEKDLNNRAIENRQKNAVSVVNTKHSSVDIEKRGGFCEKAGIVDNAINNSEERVNNDNTSDCRNLLRATNISPKTDLLKTEQDCHHIDVEDGLSVGQTAFQVIVKDDIDDESHSIMHNIVLPRSVVEDGNTELQNQTKVIQCSSTLQEAENDIDSKSKNLNTSDQNSGIKRETITFLSTASLLKCDDDKSAVLTDIAADGETEKNKCSVCNSSSVNYVCEHDKVVDIAQSDNDGNNVEPRQDAGNKVDLAQDESHSVAGSKQCGKRKCYVLCTRVEDEDRARKKMLLGLKKGKHGDSPHIVRVTKEGMIVDVTDEYQQYLPDNSE